MTSFLADAFATSMNILTPVLMTLVSIGVGRAVLYLNTRFGLNIDEQRMAQVVDFGEVAVTAVSQEFQDRVKAAAGDDREMENVNRMKRAEGVRMVVDRAKEVGLDMAEHAAGEIVESWVNKLKRARVAAEGAPAASAPLDAPG